MSSITTTLTPYAPKRFTDSALFVKVVDGQKLLIKVFANEDKANRWALEIQKNLHWRASGFSVPSLVDIKFNEILEPYVVMEYVEGTSLSDCLRAQELALAEKLKTLGDIFKINCTRHQMALERRDALLIHTDPNTDNIILSTSGPVFIDFEHISKSIGVSRAVAKEIATFARRAVKDLGVSYTKEVVEILLTTYHYNPLIFNEVEALTFGRPFQLLHRFKNKLKKLADTKLVTRYDIADAIRAYRANPVTD